MDDVWLEHLWAKKPKGKNMLTLFAEGFFCPNQEFRTLPGANRG